MKQFLTLLLLAFCFSYAEKSIAIMPCTGDFEQKGLNDLRDKIEDVAKKVLPSADFKIVPHKKTQKDSSDLPNYYTECEVDKYDDILILSFKLGNIKENFIYDHQSYSKSYGDVIATIENIIPIAIKKTILCTEKCKDNK